MLPRCDLLKVSAEDLALLFPGRAAADFAAHALAQGTAAVVVTRGAMGAMAWTANASAAAPGVKVEVVDSVGAGDAFQAATLAWLAEHDALTRAALARLSHASWQSALSFAARAAAITCSRRGADTPRRGELA